MKCERVMFHFCFLLVRVKTSYRSPWVREEKDLLLQHPPCPAALPPVLRVQNPKLALLLSFRISHSPIVLDVSSFDKAAAGSRHTPCVITIRVLSSGSGAGYLEVPADVTSVACKRSEGAAHAQS